MQTTTPTSEPDSTQASTRQLELISKLIGFDTTSSHSNLELIEFVRAYLESVGIDRVLIVRDALKKKANLFATVPAASGDTQGGVILSGHADIVPVVGQAWTSDPFQAVVRDGRLYGRGACDMKGFIGMVLGALPDLLPRRLREPLHLSLSFDEEVGCLGLPLLLDELAARKIRPSGCIVGEPTDMRPVVAHKGNNAYRCCVTGRAAHSSLTPAGVNAIEFAARLICQIRDIADTLRRDGPFDHDFPVPFGTAQTGVVSGGIAINTVPHACEFLFEYRNLPTDNPEYLYEQVVRYAREELEPQMRAVASEANISFEKIGTTVALDVEEQAAITRLVRALCNDTAVRKVTYGTEAGLFARARIPTVICGPGSIDDAHKADESVALSQLDRCAAFLGSLADAMEER
ncbi:acetylornithine deacetylase [Burkholderia multivorans]|uniref:acetylornithine deacetylase n=1 Tax=Burkholderia multivorans TaxID=87883 RepID=UPI000CFEC606|nr:acetylornithine deacetylase [Burkholderia multivorans]MBU9147179.1 acetylornithine deacetylase [Burkholderia multivorans]MBU9540840.1 acetylornithine deacetylase [Burkholderia multivorans]MDN7867717.1 acetylornithine deacetylase [Burkholderia multivorans]MDN8018897.1 acetylornithine deacetylase [Burkholderia multivorans]PRE08905.1 acetylornithine deacetylase [Burkholderia multivorans]